MDLLEGRNSASQRGGMVLGCSSPQQRDGSASWEGGMLLKKQDEASGEWGGIMVLTGKAGCFQLEQWDNSSDWKRGMFPTSQGAGEVG